MKSSEWFQWNLQHKKREVIEINKPFFGLCKKGVSIYYEAIVHSIHKGILWMTKKFGFNRRFVYCCTMKGGHIYCNSFLNLTKYVCMYCIHKKACLQIFLYTIQIMDKADLDLKLIEIIIFYLNILVLFWKMYEILW